MRQQEKAGTCPTLTDTPQTVIEGTLVLSPSDTCHILPSLPSCAAYGFIPIVQMTKLRLRKITQLVADHTVKRC